MTEPKEPRQEALTNITFGQVVLVPYFDGDIPSVVLQQFNPHYAETMRIMNDTHGRELLAQAGTSRMETLYASGQEPWDKEQIVRGMVACYGVEPDDDKGIARVRAIVEGYVAQ